MRRFVSVISVLIAAFVYAAPAPAESLKEHNFGVVFMHGKWGAPEDRPLYKLSLALESAGVALEMPTMPWSRNRNYDVSYEDAMTEIDKAVAKLKGRGAVRIVVGGHSFGANASLAYGATRNGVTGILALAPGHVPDMGRFRGAMADNVFSAKRLLADGQGDAAFEFTDLNQGRQLGKRATPKIFLSYFDPEGMGAMSLNAPKIKPDTAVFWAIGRQDSLFGTGKAAIYDKIPPHPKSRYVELPGGHVETPSESVGIVLDWLKSLAQP